MNNLKIINLELTKKCNLKCNHCGIGCSYDKNNKFNSEITVYELEKTLHKASEIGCNTLILAGGEPFISDRFWECLNLTKKYNISVSILTNGVLISEKICNELSKYDNIKFVRVSLDYPSNYQMEKFRGVENLVDKITLSLNLLKKHNIPSGIGMSLMPDNIKYIKDIAKIAFENGASFFRAVPIVPIGTAKHFHIDEDFYILSIKELIKTNEFFNKNLSRNLAKHEFDYLANLSLTNCPAGNSSISITSEGNVELCPLIENTYICENIKEKPLDMLIENLYNKKKSLQNEANNNCISCDFFNICKGGCLATNLKNKNIICLKNIFKALNNDLEIKNIFKNFFTTSALLTKTLKSINISDSMCIRALPIWYIFFNKPL